MTRRPANVVEFGADWYANSFSASRLSSCIREADTNTRCLWIDGTELLDLFRFVRYPTGVSRVVMSLADALAADSGDIFGRARTLFWDPIRRSAFTLEDPHLAPLSAFLPRLMDRYASAGLNRLPYSSRAMKAFATSLPRELRYRLFPADNGVTLFARWAKAQGIPLSPVRFAAGDCLFVPGSFWLGKYAPQLGAQARAASVPVTAFVHDVLLLSHPAWLAPRHSEQFRRGCDTFLPACAAIICNSSYTRTELQRFVPATSRLPVHTCRLADRPFARTSQSVSYAITEMLGRRYVMFVSTVIPRKNHQLLVEAWRRLRGEFGTSTPDLLFVGGGGLDPRLSEMLERERAEGGRIVRIIDADDNALDLLYEHAWMTTYPSLAEGYGIPVAEALSHGKICLAAPSGGITEIDKNLIDFINPQEPDSVVSAVRNYLRDEDRRVSREAEIKRNYRTTDWSDTARTVRSILEGTISGAGGMTRSPSLAQQA
jgi:glycosyltransferase involved in cell wall biosynthesis